MGEIGKLFVVFGIIMIVLGVILLAAGNLSGKVPWLGRLPGDIHIQRDGFSFYFPLGTSILLSIVLTLILSLLNRK
jgi:hypothetical protein